MYSQVYDIIIIGAGAGGGTLAYALGDTGKKILILERGDFLERSKDNWDASRVFGEEVYHTPERWFTKDDKSFRPGMSYLVGGQTKLYGATLFRMRKEDFEEVKHNDGISPAWPISYEEIEPYYERAEELYIVHGRRGEDPTEPPSGKPYSHPAVSHEFRIQELYDAMKGRRLNPFHLPLGIMLNEAEPSNSLCIRCDTCDGFPCLVNAKSDAEVVCVRKAVEYSNVTLLTNTKVLRLETDPSGKLVKTIVAEHKGEELTFKGDIVVLSAGAINSAVILLRSKSDRHPNGLANSSGLVGVNLMLHNNSAMIAVSPFKTNPTTFQKTIGLNDYYFRDILDDTYPYPLGHIQLLGKATAEILKAERPRVPRTIFKYISEHSVDWWLTTEDLPLEENRVELTSDGRIKIFYTENNRVSHRRLIQRLKEILKTLGFRVFLTKGMPINAVAHQCGTLRFGRDPETSVLDPFCKTHNINNLYVVDASFFPSSSSVNPALTIVANALRVADHIKRIMG